MKYITKFETESAYNAARENLILPNVSLITETNGVAYNQLNPTPTGHSYIEIGGIKWATMNIGATSITDPGQYFQWGDVDGYYPSEIGSGEGQKQFTSETYKGTNDDGVAAAWGGNWRMPTKNEFVALGNAVTTVWTADYQGSGVAGLICTDKTDNSKVLFFPAGGRAKYSSVSECYSDDYGEYMPCGKCWSSTDTDSQGYAYHLEFHYIYDSLEVEWNYTINKYQGLNLRGVLDE